ncbi:hypothetical protein PY793_00065 [Acetobacter fabarum]|uniref:hypothetical protein n=1 Tax=Acetobacter fabarum TaxID=483199 RepID=UPI00312BBC10
MSPKNADIPQRDGQHRYPLSHDAPQALFAAPCFSLFQYTGNPCHKQPLTPPTLRMGQTPAGYAALWVQIYFFVTRYFANAPYGLKNPPAPSAPSPVPTGRTMQDRQGFGATGGPVHEALAD